MRWLNRFGSGFFVEPAPVGYRRIDAFSGTSSADADAAVDLPARSASTPTVALALGGGGARGLAHLGVIQSLDADDFRINRVVGVSIGSLAGACYAVDGDADRAIRTAMRLLKSPAFEKVQRRLSAAGRWDDDPRDNYLSVYRRFRRLVTNHRRITRVATSPALLDSAWLSDAIDQLVPDIDVRETAVPLSIVAADLRSGHQVMIESGSLRQAVLGSMSIPGIFPPVPMGRAWLSDIGVLHSLPTELALSFGSDQVVAVDVGVSHAPIDHCATALDVTMRMEEVGEQLLRRHSQSLADVVIRPAVGWCTWFDFSDPERLIEAGRRATASTGLLQTGLAFNIP